MRDTVVLWLWGLLLALSLVLGVAWAFTDNVNCLLWAILYGVWADLGRPN